jgi:hypothetical protein
LVPGFKVLFPLRENRLMWMNNKFKACKNDIQIFEYKDLKAKLMATGKQAIGDGGYHGLPNELSSPNVHDSVKVHTFNFQCLCPEETWEVQW